MRSIVLLAAVHFAALLASTAQAGLVWEQHSFFETPAVTANDLAPLDYSLSFHFPGSPNSFLFALDDLTPADHRTVRWIDGTNAASYGINWAALSSDVANYRSTPVSTVSISTPLGSFSPVCCPSYFGNAPTVPLTRISIVIDPFGVASPTDPAIYFGAEIALYAIENPIPEPSSALLLLLGVVLLGCRRHGELS